MMVSCPQCGRRFEVQDLQVSQVAKCACKFSFRVGPKKDEPEPPKSTPKEPHIFVHQTKSGVDDFHDEETQDIESPLEDTELEDYLSSLKQAQKSQKSEPEAKTVELPQVFDQMIDIDESKIPEPPPAAPEIEMEEIPSPNPSSSDRVRSVRKPPVVPKTSFQDWFQENKIRVGGLFSGLLLVSFAIFYFYPEKAQEEEVDEFLEEMLTPRESSKATPSSANVRRTAKKEATGRIPTTSSKSTNTSARRTSNKALNEAMAEGRHEIGQRYLSQVNSLQANDRALVYESFFLSEKMSPAKKAEVFEILKMDLQKDSRASVLKRSEALGLASLNRSAEALAIFRSLLITRASDAWVYAYTGWVYHREGKQQLALKAWNQALTLDSRLTWVRSQREKLVQNIVYQD